MFVSQHVKALHSLFGKSLVVSAWLGSVLHGGLLAHVKACSCITAGPSLMLGDAEVDV